MKTIDNQIVTIPNNKITTSVVMNYSMPDPMVKMTIPVSAAYGSDVELVKTILVEVAEDALKNTEFFVADPKPRAFFVEFGASDLKFVVYVGPGHIIFPTRSETQSTPVLTSGSRKPVSRSRTSRSMST